MTVFPPDAFPASDRALQARPEFALYASCERMRNNGVRGVRTPPMHLRLESAGGA